MAGERLDRAAVATGNIVRFDEKRVAALVVVSRMQRYFFHSKDGGQHLDREGAEFPDLPAARVAATAYLAELLREDPESFWKEGRLQVVVTNAAGVALSVLTLSGAQTLPGAEGEGA